LQAHECSGCDNTHLSGFTLEFYAKKSCIDHLAQERFAYMQAGFMPKWTDFATKLA
jgi:hypothetical protein